MAKLVTLGELLIDFTECGISRDGQRLFEQNPGGAVANVACAAAKMGIDTAFIGKVGNDMHGIFLKETLAGQGVNVENLVIAEDVFTTLAFVAIAADGERQFSFARKPGADTCLREGELDTELLKGCEMFHCGSLSLTDEPSRGATLAAIKLAKQSGAVISYDPNYRASLWTGVDVAKIHMRSVLPFADMVKISDEETELLTDRKNPSEAIDALLANGAKIAVVTLGKNGAMAGVGSFRVSVPTFEGYPVADTTGAGDSFWGAFISRVLKAGGIDAIDGQRLEESVRFANAAATLCVGRRGGIPAMPDESQTNSVCLA
ncbi:MAG: carbohydrate kinase [Oscillospiraceae bacterium]